MIQLYDADNSQHRQNLLRATPKIEAFPRRTVYGATPKDDEPVLIPFGEQFPDKLVDPKDYKATIEHCHEAQVFPIYHQHATWGKPGFVWNQNGLPYCWAWGGTAALMDLRAREGKPVPLLSPVSMGWLVGWKNAGNYLGSMIQGLMDKGVCEASFTPNMLSRDPRTFKEGWEDNALLNRLKEAWDCDNGSPSAMVQHSISILATGTPLYIAYNWWGHALECCGVRWTEGTVNNLTWQIRNSHAEDDIIEMVGAKAVFDEAYGFRAAA
jgi:hypothetical protein